MMINIFFGRNSGIFLAIVMGFCLAGKVIDAGAVSPSAPKINAKSWLLMDFDSGQILSEGNANTRLPPASLTKIMTVYVVANDLSESHLSLSDMVVVSEKAWRMPGSRMFIEVGKRVTVKELLKGVIISSGNDASVALAEFISGSEEMFVERMNEYAEHLGMTGTNFVNSTGLPDEQHYMTAHDLAILSRALIRDFPDIYAWHSIKEYTYNKIKQHNRNNLLWRDNSVDGIKTGHTESAGYCLVASANRDNMRLISIVLGSTGSESRIKASRSLLNYGFRFYETYKLYSLGQAVTAVRIWKGENRQLDVGLGEDLFVTVPRDQYKNLTVEVKTANHIIAPVKKNEPQGVLQVSLAGKKILQVPVISLNDVAEGSFLRRLKDGLQLLFE